MRSESCVNFRRSYFPIGLKFRKKNKKSSFKDFKFANSQTWCNLNPKCCILLSPAKGLDSGEQRLRVKRLQSANQRQSQVPTERPQTGLLIG